jgi:hypothetical protein
MAYLTRRWLVDVQQAYSPSRDGSPQAPAERQTRAYSGSGSQDGLAWSALDDHQPTRLLGPTQPREAPLNRTHMTRSQLSTAARMELEFPMSLGVADRYVKALHVVDSPCVTGHLPPRASVNQIVVTKYELLVARRQPPRAHELLATMPREVTI